MSPVPEPKAVPVISYEELRDLVLEFVGEEGLFRIEDFISAGYSILVYSNHDLGHPMLGHRVFLKCGYGCTVEEIPPYASTIPIDPGWSMMAWRYCLDAVYPQYHQDAEDR